MILLKVGGGGPKWEGGQEKFSGRGVEERREDGGGARKCGNSPRCSLKFYCMHFFPRSPWTARDHFY